MPAISLDAIRAASDIPTETVPVPEWGEGAEVIVRGLTKAAATALFEACTIEGEGGAKTVDAKKLQDELLLACVVEPKLDRAALALLEEKANAPVNRIQLACVRVAGLAPDALAKAKS